MSYVLTYPLMVIVILIVLGLSFGSFVNALVWRLHEQSLPKNKRNKTKALAKLDLSIMKGRSMCPECHHLLSANDLVPLLSWVELKGKCRYCHKPISKQYPLVEFLTAVLFVVSYIYWPFSFSTMGIFNFIIWCITMVGFMALLVYDLRWLLLPNRITYPLIILSAFTAIINITVFHGGIHGLKDIIISLVISAGIFWTLFQISKGKWIGGGDVKFGVIAGLLIAVPLQSFLVLFFASLIGTLVIIPGLLSKKITAKSHIPFGPFLIIATIIVKLFGSAIATWYRRKFLLY